jgi:Na+-translocating membrane potential-generating system (MpsC)
MTEAVAQLSAPPATSSLAVVSRRLVQLMRRRAGRGPTHAKANWAGEDAVLVLFEGGYTKAEQTLWAQGRADAALSYRHAVLDALEDDMRAVLEQELERPVRTVLACARHAPETMAVVFLLEPLGGSDSVSAGRWGAGDEPAPHPSFGASAATDDAE